MDVAAASGDGREEQAARGPDADYCPSDPVGGHAIATHMQGGALASVRRCITCGWIDFADLDEQVRSGGHGGAREVRAAGRPELGARGLGLDVTAPVTETSAPASTSARALVAIALPYDARTAFRIVSMVAARWEKEHPGEVMTTAHMETRATELGQELVVWDRPVGEGAGCRVVVTRPEVG